MPLFTVRFQENEDYDVILADSVSLGVSFITCLVTEYDQYERNVPGRPKPTHLQNSG